MGRDQGMVLHRLPTVRICARVRHRGRYIHRVTALIEIIATTLQNVAGTQPVAALFLFFLTIGLVASGVPGVIVPLSVSSGALLGCWLGLGVVILGAVFGSQALFLSARKFMQKPLRLRFGNRLERLEHELDRRGFGYIVVLRLVGVPHALVTAASAVSPVKGELFAAATLLGFLPVVAFMARAGAAL